MGLFNKKPSDSKLNQKNQASFYDHDKFHQKAIQEMNAGNGKKAFQLYSKAAEGHHWSAKYMVGACYEDGIGVTKDLKKAFAIYQSIAVLEDASHFYWNLSNMTGLGLARFRLGLFYEQGWGTKQDINKAMELYTKISKDSDCMEAVFLSCRQMHWNFHNGYNGWPINYRVSHEWAVKGIEAYEKFERQTAGLQFANKEIYRRDYHAMLQYAAYSFETGRGVPEDIPNGIPYRRKAAELFRDPLDACFACWDYLRGHKYEQAEEMRRWVTDFGGDFEANVRTRRDCLPENMRTLETTVSNELFHGLDTAPTRNQLICAAELYLRGFCAIIKDHNYVTLMANRDFGKALGYAVRAIRMDSVDQTPLTVQENLPAESLQRYVLGRLSEKAGDFLYAKVYYILNHDKYYTESIFRMLHIDLSVYIDEDSARSRLDDLRKITRPLYGNSDKEPTFALSQLVEQQDPEAMAELAKIYRKKETWYDTKFANTLTRFAISIYKQRAEAGDPEAMYRLVDLMEQVNEDGSVYFVRAARAQYSLAFADLSTPDFSAHVSAENQQELRRNASLRGARLKSYLETPIPPMRYKDAVKRCDQLEENQTAAEKAKLGYFKQVSECLKNADSFAENVNLKCMIRDGVIDALGDQHLAAVIKQLANQ